MNASQQSLKALNALNLFLADVRDGVGPYLAIYLSASLHWSPSNIGIAMATSGLAAVVAQTPAGALVDRIKSLRGLVVVAAILVALGSLLMIARPVMPVVVIGQILCGVAGAIFGPAIAAITLGLVGHQEMPRAIGRNESWNHGGNVMAAALAGLTGHFLAREGIFILVALMGVGCIFAVLRIRPGEIDYAIASGGDGDGDDKTQRKTPLAQLFKNRTLLIFAGAVILFHFANAAMLPLVGQKLASGKAGGASLYMSACIIIAQLVMIPVATLTGKYAAILGRKPVFLIAFIVLPIRGALYVLSDNPYYLIAVQSLDGVVAGIFGVLSVIVVADLTAGTGRFNFTSGALGTATGIGASLSTLMTGFILEKGGYTPTFLTLAGIALIALIVYWFQMPETQNDARSGRSEADLSTIPG